MSYIPLQSAAEQLGVTDACLVRDCEKYRPFFKKSDPKKRNATFNLIGFLKAEELKEELVAKTQLLTEYLHHIEGMTYMDMSRLTGVVVQQIASCVYGYTAALKLSRAIRDNKPHLFRRFHEYYGWEVKR